jgi:Transposase and inactivated derivatives, IS30 family
MRNKTKGKFKHLTHADRLSIERMLRTGVSVLAIAKEIGVNNTTIYREMKRARYLHRNSDLTEEERYSSDLAQMNYKKAKKRKKKTEEIREDTEFIEFVEKMVLKEKYSFEAMLAIIDKNNLKFKTRVCLTSLYNYAKRGIFPNIELRDMPYKKSYNKKKKRVQKRANKGTSIEKRPEIIEERTEFGDWEMDTVVSGKKGKGCLLVFTERKTRYELIEYMKENTTNEVVRVLNKFERSYGIKQFRKLFKSITVDNGMEFMDLQGMEEAKRSESLRTKLYYCHAYSSWERGSNENQNKLIRRHIPKGSDISTYSREDIKRVAEWINNYPRKIFRYKNSWELFQNELKLLH